MLAFARFAGFASRLKLHSARATIGEMPPAATEKVDRYDIMALIGKGSIGEVYTTHDPRPATGGKNMIDAKPNVDHF